MAPLTAVCVGAGQRGRHVYGRHALEHRDELRFVAVVEPDADRRNAFGDEHDIPQRARFDDVGALPVGDLLAEAAVIASPDRSHFTDATTLLGAGYHVILEKPMAATLEETTAIVAAARATDRVMLVAHVLRYTPFFRTLNEVVTSGRLGDLVTVEHRENVWAFHMAHSFVRGNWGRAAAATPMIVQKCCHDFDILAWNLDSPVARLSSVGSLFEFHPDRAPVGATARCSDGCPVEGCPYDARSVYLDPVNRGWPVHVITDDLSSEGRLRALRDGPYGICVYTAGSDVVDHQVVTMELESGASCVLVMHGHSAREGRSMRYDGTRATLRATTSPQPHIEVTDHRRGITESIPITAARGSHGGGDSGIIASFIAAIRNDAPAPTTAATSLESHLLAFAAERVRRTGEIIDIERLRREVTT